jgi:MYXO-CTERM domain-containing protein
MARTLSTVAVALALSALAGSAQATFFSFASDGGDSYFTFRGTAGTGGSFNITEGSPAGLPGPSATQAYSPITLRIDDNNGSNPRVDIRTKFTANLTASYLSSANIFGSLWQHTYRVTGSFSFLDAVTGNLLLRADILDNSGGILTVPGGANTWSSVGAVLGADSFPGTAGIQYTATSDLVTAMGGAAAAAMYNIVIPSGNTQQVSVGPDDFGFDLTVLNVPAAGSQTPVPGAQVALNPQTFLPTQAWASESSFSGSAVGGIPTPGAAALMGLGGLVAARRRRN